MPKPITDEAEVEKLMRPLRLVLPEEIVNIHKSKLLVLLKAARVDELEKFSHSSGSLHLLAEKVSYKPEGHDPVSTWPILEAPGGLIIVMRSYIKDRLATLNSEDGMQG